MSDHHLIIPPVPRGVYLTPRIVAELASEWTGLPEPIEAVLDAMRFGPEPWAYTKEVSVPEAAAIRRELRGAYKSAQLRRVWKDWTGDELLDNHAAPLVLGLAVCGTIYARASERSRAAYLSIQRSLDPERGVRIARPQLEPLHLGDGTIDMSKLVWSDVQPPEDSEGHAA